MRRPLSCSFSCCGRPPDLGLLKAEAAQQKAIVPAGFLLSTFDTLFACGVLLNQGQRHAPQTTEVFRPIAGADAALILVKSHVQPPMQPILDIPMAQFRGRLSFYLTFSLNQHDAGRVSQMTLYAGVFQGLEICP